MNSPQTGLRVASVFFGIFAIAHLLRLINQAQVTVGTLSLPPFFAFGLGDWVRHVDSLRR